MEHTKERRALIGSSPTFDFADKFVKQNAHFGNEERAKKGNLLQAGASPNLNVSEHAIIATRAYRFQSSL